MFRAGATCFAGSALELCASGVEHAAAGRRCGFHFRLSTGSTGTVAVHGCSGSLIGIRWLASDGLCITSRVFDGQSCTCEETLTCARAAKTQSRLVYYRAGRTINREVIWGNKCNGAAIYILIPPSALGKSRQLKPAGIYQFRANADRQLLQSLIVPTRELQKLRHLYYRLKARLRQGYVR